MNDGVPQIGTGLQTVIRATRVLKAFGKQPEWGVTALAGHLGLSKSMTHRLVSTLAEEGFLARVGSGSYVLGSELTTLARSAAGRLTVSVVSRPHMDRLARKVGAVVTLPVLSGHRCVFVDIVDLGTHVRSVVQLGDTLMLGVGAGGRAILAFQDQDFIDQILDEPVYSYTDRSPTTADEIAKRLAEVRRLGWSYSEGEVTPGTATVAAPIRDATGHVIASLNITTTSSRIAGAEKQALSDEVVRVADLISADLGFTSNDT